MSSFSRDEWKNRGWPAGENMSAERGRGAGNLTHLDGHREERRLANEMLQALQDPAYARRECATREVFDGPVPFVLDVDRGEFRGDVRFDQLFGGVGDAVSLGTFLARFDAVSRVEIAELLERASIERSIPTTTVRLREGDSTFARAELTARAMNTSPGSGLTMMGTLTPAREERALDRAQVLADASNESAWNIRDIDRLAGVGCWRWEPSTGRLAWSAVLCELAGLDSTIQPCAALHLSLIHPDDRTDVKEVMRGLQRGETPEPFEYRIIREADGEVRRLLVHARVITDDRGDTSVCVGTARDITMERDLEQRLHHSQKMEAIGRLAGGVAHDFNNYLVVMSGNADLLAREMSSRDPRRRFIDEIMRASDRARLLVRQLLAFSRRQITEPRLINVNEVLSNVHRMLELMLGEQISLETILYDDLYDVVTDPSQFEQIVVNLAVNARDAIEGQGMVLIETSNEEVLTRDPTGVTAIPPGHYAKIAVTDDGEGIAEEVMENIFEPFFTTKEEGYGTGLGLSTVYGIVRRFNGFVRLNSTVGAGTTFEILFPRADIEDSAVARRVFGDSDRIPVASGGTVLFTEDESQVRVLTRMQLERGGYNVLSASNASEALEIARNYEGTIEALVTDIVMPGLNGIELASMLSAELPHLQVLFVSGYAEQEIPKEGPLKYARLLPKPFTMKELLTSLGQLIGAHRERVGAP